MQVCDIKIREKVVKLQLWDTAGQERYKSITSQFYRDAHAVILVFDLSCEKSFQSIADWLSIVHKNCSGDIFKILVGNKSDLEPAIKNQDIEVCKCLHISEI